MRKIVLALVAAGLLAATGALPAAAAQKSQAGVTKSQASSVQLSARRYHRHYYRYGYYRPYYRPYYAPYYAYGPGPYYYGRPYYRPFPFGFFPFY
jgi:Ni/Co efflux regulator RcnB